ncbi:hypothetical protein MHF_1102 [Mycoplasma haemofelis Ohio2]|uniref:Uncharacterized protein n=1 Tax=Mycoplasma haemofelis (strain Ohio2) TaxID=859194 RepID=F6FJJ5_MYCHI|nr:hypothetical protein MHF_1102 [Mycoplasma haemofelis Ohio2]
MNKLVPVSLGALGAGGLGAGGWALSRSKVIDPYSEKYKFAILKDEDRTLWEEKFKLLASATPSHETLKKASGSQGDESSRKANHKKGCHEIYGLSTKDTKYLEDFKKYCSKNNGDVMGSGWISETTEPPTSPSKWDTKLTSLKNKKDQETVKALKELAAKLTESTFDKGKRDELKTWCDGGKSGIYLGEDDPSTKVIRSYCVE